MTIQSLLALITDLLFELDIEEFKSPIMYYEHKQNEESWFIVVHGKYAYRYKLNAKALKK